MINQSDDAGRMVPEKLQKLDLFGSRLDAVILRLWRERVIEWRLQYSQHHQLNKAPIILEGDTITLALLESELAAALPMARWWSDIDIFSCRGEPFESGVRTSRHLPLKQRMELQQLCQSLLRDVVFLLFEAARAQYIDIRALSPVAKVNDRQPTSMAQELSNSRQWIITGAGNLLPYDEDGPGPTFVNPTVERFEVANDGVLKSPLPLTTGAPGRPSSMYLVIAEFLRLYPNRELPVGQSIQITAKKLEAWLKDEHPNAPPLTAKTIGNELSKQRKFVKQTD